MSGDSLDKQLKILIAVLLVAMVLMIQAELMDFAISKLNAQIEDLKGQVLWYRQNCK